MDKKDTNIHLVAQLVVSEQSYDAWEEISNKADNVRQWFKESDKFIKQAAQVSQNYLSELWDKGKQNTALRNALTDEERSAYKEKLNIANHRCIHCTQAHHSDKCPLEKMVTKLIH